ncbi:hypothetical protein [Heliothis virescens ascovirus 3j]|uniref:Uncharacterized protein n=1 Tax=Heliothis virescens ascovirus 3j TaxID=1561067 RepID=A0A2Z5UZG7_9VIRU|nr:hypothetical protein [Heliothis virescens ascovirus 3j]
MLMIFIMDRIQSTPSLKMMIADNDDGIGCWTHRVAIMFRCCGKMYTIEAVDTDCCVLFAPRCLCEPTQFIYNCFVQNVITDGNGCATLYCCYYSSGETCSTTKSKYSIRHATPDNVSLMFPEQCRENLGPALQEITNAGGMWVCAVSQHENSTHRRRPCSNQVSVLDTPTRLFCNSTSTGSLIKFNARFDTSSVVWLRNYYDAEDDKNDKQHTDDDYEDDDDDYYDDEDGGDDDGDDDGSIWTFEDFKRLFAGLNERDAGMWKYCDSNAQQMFGRLRKNSTERDKIIEYIERINGAHSSFSEPSRHTYYGSKLLIFLLDLQNDPLISYYECEIFGKIKHIYKDDARNAEIERWCAYDGNIHLFKTCGLYETIQKVKFDAGYKWFVKNVIPITPVLFNRSKINYYCNKPNTTCIPDGEYGEQYSVYSANGLEYVSKCNNEQYTVLLSNAIKRYAAENGNTFELVSGYGNNLLSYKLLNVDKYKQLWHFLDLANVFHFTRTEVNCFNNCHFENKSGDGYVCSWHGVVSTSGITKYHTLYNRYHYMSPFHNFVQGVYKTFIVNQHWMPDRSLFKFESCFPRQFIQTYLKPYRANHRHELLKCDMTKSNTIIGELGWPSPDDRHVLISERKLILVGLQRWIKDKLYRPDSETVKKIKERFQTMCMNFE